MSGGTIFFSVRNDADSAGESFMDVTRSGAAIVDFRILRNTTTGNLAIFGTGSYGGGQKVVFIANATTAPSSAPVAGVIPYARAVATNKSNLFVKNEDNKVTRLTGVDARAAADVVISASTTLANVTGLTFDLEAGKTYSFVARIMWELDGAGGGIQHAINGTATITNLRYSAFVHPDSSTTPGRTTRTIFGTGVGSSTGTLGYTEITGTITVNAAGTLVVQHAQLGATGTSTTKRGSTFHLREIT
jgi:hypothetical protein